ncbi:MAG: MBL fold metallo-hydrolase [Candidatus Wolfebacteria bacterium]|nr:MBL fold metallo-hydrolase [Candidatus Wolfebacteria bacterium]
MIITWYGEGCFKIQSGDFAVLTDPIDAKSGLSAPRFKANVVLKTINPFPPILEKEENEILGAGEYNFGEANIWGIPLPNESTEKYLKTAYILELEGMKLAFLGHISESPEPTAMERLTEEADIIFIPGGGKPFIEQKIAAKLIKQIEPKIVIPSFFKIPGLKRQSEDLKTFSEEINHGKSEPQEKLTVKRKDLTEIKSTQIVILKV